MEVGNTDLGTTAAVTRLALPPALRRALARVVQCEQMNVGPVVRVCATTAVVPGWGGGPADSADEPSIVEGAG